jgi:diguanylate cyclase (GGDEF)-like protein
MADALEHQATVDELTGLFNLRHLSSHLEALINEAVQKAEPLSVVFCDLNNLKRVNDSYGHEAGDRMLQAVARTIQAWAGERGICWRLSTGGDEFVVALPGESGAEATRREEVLRQAVASILLPVADSQIRPSISLGVSSYPEDGSSAAIMGIADKRMYADKIGHGNDRRDDGVRLANTTAA